MFPPDDRGLESLMQGITDFGDSAVLLPVSGLVLAALWLGGARRSAVAWGVAVGLCCLVVVGLKILLRPCDQALIADSLRNPSGHAAFAAVVYGCLSLLIA